MNPAVSSSLSDPIALLQGIVLLLLLLLAVLGGMAWRLYQSCRQLQQAAARRLGDSEERLAAIAFELQESIFICDPQGTILRVNRAYTELTGFDAEEVVGQKPDVFKSGQHDDLFYRGMLHALSIDGHWQGEVWCRRKNGEEYPCWLNVTAVQGEESRNAHGGGVSHYIAAFTDVSERKQNEARIRQLAFYDPLTQLPNRRLLMDRLNHAIISTMRHNTHGAVLFIDLDNFKILNDTKGHHIGDQLLLHVAERLKACVRAEDTVSRLGGDEFLVMLENLSPEAGEAAREVERVAEKVRLSLSQPYFFQDRQKSVDPCEFHSTPSIGICLFRGCTVPVDEILKRADMAMYQAKDAGCNTYRFFDPAMQAALESHTALEASLRQALLAQQFEVHYQAQVDSNQRIWGAEALLRWKHPVRGMVSPAEFIPVAETTHLILPIGHWVLLTVCRQIKVWEKQADKAHLRVAVNVSARQFSQQDFVREVREVVEITGIDPSRLKLELTESLLLDNVNDAVDKMRALKAIGIGFSLDDFGTGHSSLAYLKRLPLEQLKIDQSFVRDITSDPDDAVIVQAIIGIARHLSLNIIAEGVETSDQCSFLETHGCHTFQGYLFSRPLPLDAFERLVEARCSTSHPAGGQKMGTE